MRSPKVSVIMPVYNSEKWISRSLGSLAAQTFADFEALLVDDASTDGSYAVLNGFASRDERFKPIALEKNGGAGNARNIGIVSAKGEYLAFLDADDEYSPDFLELLVKKADETGADVTVGTKLTLYREDECEDEAWMNAELRRIANTMLKYRNLKSLMQYVVSGYIHYTAIYRREFIIENGIRYGNTPVGEDTTFVIQVAVNARSTEVEPGAVYRSHYIEGSLSHPFSQKRIDSLIGSIREQRAVLEGAVVEKGIIQMYLLKRLHFALRLYTQLLYTEQTEVDTDAYKAEMLKLMQDIDFDTQGHPQFYPVGVFYRSGGAENIHPISSAVRETDSLRTRCEDLKTIARHLVSSPNRAENGIDYLRVVIKKFFQEPPHEMNMDTRWYRNALAKEIQSALSILNTQDMLDRMLLHHRAMIEYGENIIPTDLYEGTEMSCFDGIQIIANIAALTETHRDASKKYLDYADELASDILKTIAAKNGEHPEYKKKVMAALMIELKKLNAVKEKRKGAEQ